MVSWRKLCRRLRFVATAEDCSVYLQKAIQPQPCFSQESPTSRHVKFASTKPVIASPPSFLFAISSLAENEKCSASQLLNTSPHDSENISISPVIRDSKLSTGSTPRHVLPSISAYNELRRNDQKIGKSWLAPS